jgi:hypothetical protein
VRRECEKRRPSARSEPARLFSLLFLSQISPAPPFSSYIPIVIVFDDFASAIVVEKKRRRAELRTDSRIAIAIDE